MKRKPTLKEASPSPSKGGDVPNPTYILSSFQTVCNKDIPSFGGAWGGFLFGGGALPCYWSILFFILLFFWFGGGGEAFLLLPRRIIHIHLQLL